VPTILIDGRAVECGDGATVLDALRQLGVSVPTLCHDDRLVPTAACRSCLVDIEGHARPVPACATRIEAGMVVQTSTDALQSHRRTVLSLLAAHYPMDVVGREPEREFHRAVAAYGPCVDEVPERVELTGRFRDDTHPYFDVDMARCIDCYRCVRICDEVQGQHVWHVRQRGEDTEIVPDGPSMLESSCVSCGACVDTCPTGALRDRQAVPVAPVDWTRTVCPYCGTGCEMLVGTSGGRIAGVRPALDSPVSKGHLCVKGRYAYGFTESADRVTKPLIRENGEWREVTWDHAVTFVADRLSAIAKQHGPDAIGILGSARATNEDNYVAQKLARVAIGTNNVDCCARVCHAPSAAGLKTMLGAGLATSSFDDIERAKLILVCGANPTENHPIVGARIRQAARNGARLIVIDPRHIELAEEADIHLAIRPGTNLPLLNALAHVIVSERLHDGSFVKSRVDGLEPFEAFVAGWTPERASAICGIDPESIRSAARLYAGSGPAMIVHGLGVTEHTQGTDGVMALINLALLTGNVGRPGAGVNPLRGQNNVQGSAHMGCEPNTLPGSASIKTGKEPFEREWGRPISSSRGLHMLEMMDAAESGHLKALWVMGYDILLTNPNVSASRRSLAALDLVVVQDLFMTETAKEFGSVFLPACSPFERDGTFMNAERRIQRVRAALEPAGESRPDWQIVADVGRAMGAQGFDFSGPAQIWDEVRRVSSGARGMSYDRLERGGLQWPCPSDDHPGTALLHVETFAGEPRASLQCLDYRPSPETVTPEYPFLLITGRSLYQFNASTMTGRTPNAVLRPRDLLDIAPDDASALKVADGDEVRITSRNGDAVLEARLSPAVTRGQLFATFHTPETWVNLVTSSLRDPRTGTPEYKVTAVRLAKR
jgi:formate dehydrogenase major subunit